VVISRAVIERVLGEQSSFLIEDALGDTELRDRESILTSAVRTAMAAPLFDNERVIGMLYTDTSRAGRPYTTDELRAFTMLANVVAVALTHARYRAVESEKHRLETELGAARRIMNVLLPRELPGVPGCRLTSHYEPCSEVGGDLYDVIDLDDGRFALVIGDVAGKGLGATLLVSSLLPLVRGLSGDLDNLPATFAHLNSELMRITEPFRYATLFVGILNPSDGRLVYANAGHNPPLVVRLDGGLDQLSSTGLPVAIVQDATWRTAEARLDPGDMLVLFSDGITEAWNSAGDDYSESRLCDILSSLAGHDVDAVRDAVLVDVDTFLDGTPTSDDVTMLILSREA
jgi:serine phosphatase RsbU (regulator of sigma subunit)